MTIDRLVQEYYWKPFVRGKSGRWSHRVSNKDGLEDGFQRRWNHGTTSPKYKYLVFQNLTNI